MHGEILRFDDAGGAVALAAERNIVGIEQHAVIPPLRRADAVIRALYLCKIANGDDLIAWSSILRKAITEFALSSLEIQEKPPS